MGCEDGGHAVVSVEVIREPFGRFWGSGGLEVKLNPASVPQH